MTCWKSVRAVDFIDFNPHLNLKKGTIATKIGMDKLKPFSKKITEAEKAEFNGGAKFCNGDTIMARITLALKMERRLLLICLMMAKLALAQRSSL